MLEIPVNEIVEEKHRESTQSSDKTGFFMCDTNFTGKIHLRINKNQSIKLLGIK